MSACCERDPLVAPAGIDCDASSRWRIAGDTLCARGCGADRLVSWHRFAAAGCESSRSARSSIRQLHLVDTDFDADVDMIRSGSVV